MQRPIDNNAASGDWETAAVQAIDIVVHEAVTRYLLLPITCKEKVLVGWYILKTTFGFPAEVVFSINMYTFQARAWVECGLKIVTDD